MTAQRNLAEFPETRGETRGWFNAAKHWANQTEFARGRRETRRRAARAIRNVHAAMELERHQLDLRYEALRTRNARRERQLLASLADSGQRTPIVVVRDGASLVLVDGYKRVRALRQLGRDTLAAVEWSMTEVEALLLERILRASDADSAIEEGWFLREMHERFGLTQEELAHRFDRTKSWVSRRIALVGQLPPSVQEHVRAGAIGAHAAMKSLVPMARANVVDCARMAEAIAPERLSDRQIGELYATYASGNTKTRELVVSAPMTVLKAREEARNDRREKTPRDELVDDVRIVTAVARRAHGRVRDGALAGVDASEWRHLSHLCSDALAAIESVRRRCEKEAADVGSEHAGGDPAAA